VPDSDFSVILVGSLKFKEENLLLESFWSCPLETAPVCRWSVQKF